MNCESFRNDLELYSLGVLEMHPANELTEHLATGCPICHEALRQALEQNRLVSSTVPLVDPPASLRRRLHAAIAPASVPRFRWLPWAVAAAAVLLLTFGLTLQFRHIALESGAQVRVSAMLQILGSPGTRSVAFVDPKAPALHGALYIHQNLGVVMVVDRLPNAPAGWRYQSWVVLKFGAPQPVESFQPDSSGRVISLIPGHVNPDTSSIAVSMEPDNSRPDKPTKLVFAART